MKRLVFLMAAAPGWAWAHGMHAPLPEVAHDLGHAVPLAGLVLAAAILGGALYTWWRS